MKAEQGLVPSPLYSGARARAREKGSERRKTIEAEPSGSAFRGRSPWNELEQQLIRESLSGNPFGMSQEFNMQGAQHCPVAHPDSIARSADLMSVDRSCLVVIDLQERLLPVIRSSLSVATTVRFLLDVAVLLRVPAVVSEQYPQGLGSTVESLADHPAVIERFEKLSFSAATPIQQMFPRHICLPEISQPHAVSAFGSTPSADSGISTAAVTSALPRSTDLPIIDVDQMILCGIESHICVLQTALDLLAMGYRVSVVADAIGSRRLLDHEIAMQRMRDAGCTILTSESVAFEWCQQAGTDVFRSFSQLVRGRP